jgi:tetratricopeptide (TPR) repeat protein
MTRRIGTTLVLTAAVATVTPTATAGQDIPAQNLSRYAVLVPDLEPLEAADRGFGRDAARELRELMGTLPTHEAIARRDIERGLDEVDLDMEDLDCPTARQLAVRMDARVVLCAAYEERERGSYAVTATFYDVRSGESFAVRPTTSNEDGDEGTARHIFDQFDTYVRHLRAAANCEGYAQSRLWDDALRNCDEALELNAEAIGTRYRRARILFDTERQEASLEELARVLERDPIHESALQLAGFVSATLGRTDDAVDYYGRYLQLDPTNAAVRMRVAYELATAGDPPGAMLLIEEGIDLDPSNATLWEQLGGYAMGIGERMNRGAAEGDAGALPPDAISYYRRAIEAYGRVFELRGAETDPAHLRSIVIAHVRLDEPEPAVETAERALETHPDDARLWSAYADALRRAGRLQTALQALDRVEAIDPAYPDLRLRRANWLLEDGRVLDAVDVLRVVAEREPERADVAARLVLQDAHANGVQEDRFDYAIEAISAVGVLPNLSDATRHALNFWHGYSLLRIASGEQEPRTVESARAALPKFLEVRALFADVGDYPATVNVQIATFREQVETFIEIQEAIIRRGGGA